MVEAADLLRLPYDDSLTEAGVAYACKSLQYTYNRMSLQPIPRLRKIVAGIAVELAFRRWLERESVRYELLGATHFTAPDKYDITLGGRRCDVKSFLISNPARIKALRANPDYLLSAPALVPLDQLNSDSLGPHDIFIFGFLAGRETHYRSDLQKALVAGSRHYLLYACTAPEWARPERWVSLGQLTLKSNASREFTVEVGGQNQKREAHAEQITLPPRTLHQAGLDYYSLLYLHAPELSDGELSIYSPVLRRTLAIQPGDWGNIWVYGLQVIIAGWLSKRDFQRRSRLLPAGERTLLYDQTRIHNREVPIKNLRPIGELISLLRESGWS